MHETMRRKKRSRTRSRWDTKVVTKEWSQMAIKPDGEKNLQKNQNWNPNLQWQVKNKNQNKRKSSYSNFGGSVIMRRTQQQSRGGLPTHDITEQKHPPSANITFFFILYIMMRLFASSSTRNETVLAETPNGKIGRFPHAQATNGRLVRKFSPKR
ncbi:hypothetical protein CDAR_39791 [Caerostris darwini]|uniref:Transmembrane protein n=1 Tax=Caerostris darwini TaxID=1538125 RepID=A0AAV4U6D2_9ARAC|nr:hypothetical protein CDAR_39791 [Caerostris darwini]